MLLNILKYTEHPPTTKNYPVPNVKVEKLRNLGVDLCLRGDPGSFPCTNLDIFQNGSLRKGVWMIMPYVPSGNMLGKLPFGYSVVINKHHLQRTTQFPHFELLDWWTCLPD